MLRGPGDASAYRVFEPLACLDKFQLPAMCNTDPPHGCNAKFDHLPARKRSTKRLRAILARVGAGRQACVDP
jgi:hypothetical protein